MNVTPPPNKKIVPQNMQKTRSSPLRQSVSAARPARLGPSGSAPRPRLPGGLVLLRYTVHAGGCVRPRPWPSGITGSESDSMSGGEALTICALGVREQDNEDEDR